MGPVIERAEACHDPVRRLGYAILAEQCQDLFDSVPSLWQELAAAKQEDAARRFLAKIKGIIGVTKLLD